MGCPWGCLEAILLKTGQLSQSIDMIIVIGISYRNVEPE